MIKGKLTVRPYKALGKLNKEIVIQKLDASDADATPDVVITGRTFYAGRIENRQVGTLKAYKLSLKDVEGRNTLEAKSIGFSPWDELTTDRVEKLEINGVNIPVGVDTSDATITEQTVIKDYIGYGKDGERIVGELEAYQVEEQIIGPNESRLIVTKLQDSDSDDFETKAINIEFMKSVDNQDAVWYGGTLASNEEYEQVEEELQEIFYKIMIGRIYE